MQTVKQVPDNDSNEEGFRKADPPDGILLLTDVWELSKMLAFHAPGDDATVRGPR